MYISIKVPKRTTFKERLRGVYCTITKLHFLIFWDICLVHSHIQWRIQDFISWGGWGELFLEKLWYFESTP